MITEIHSPFERTPEPGLATRCVVLDAVADAELHRWIYQLAPDGAPRWAPLFAGTKFAALTDSGPAYVLCDELGDWSNYASALLEQSNSGCVLYLDNQQDWEESVKHLQSLLTVRTEQRHNQLMRFFEPRWLEPLIATLTPEEQQDYLGPFKGLAWRNELGWRYVSRAHPWNGAAQEPGWLRIGAARLQAMAQARLSIIARELATDYRAVLLMPEREAFVYEQLRVAQGAGVEQKAHHERWLRLALSSKDTPWPTAAAKQVMAREDLAIVGKLDELERLLG